MEVKLVCTSMEKEDGVMDRRGEEEVMSIPWNAHDEIIAFPSFASITLTVDISRALVCSSVLPKELCSRLRYVVKEGVGGVVEEEEKEESKRSSE